MKRQFFKQTTDSIPMKTGDTFDAPYTILLNKMFTNLDYFFSG